METKYKVLFVSSGNLKDFEIAPFIKSQGESLRLSGIDLDYFTINSKGFMGYLKNILSLRKFIKDNNFGLIHVHYALSGWTVILARTGLPVIVSFMGCDVYGDVKSNGKRYISSYLNIFSAILLQPLVDKIIVKSQNLYSYIYLKHKTQIIPNGIDLGLLKPYHKIDAREKLGLDKESKYILFLGDRSNTRKNFELLDNTIKYISDPKIKLLNPFPITHELIPYYLSATDIMVLTSFLEGSPNVIKEAMACNCPIVSTDVGDVKEIIGNTEGCFVTCFDPNEVAEKIKSALEFNKRTNGRERILELGLDSQTVAKKIIELYRDVLNA